MAADRLGRECYATRTVQAGTPMTVKEMGLPWRRGGPFRHSKQYQL